MARSVLAVTLNAAIDKTLAVSDFQVGHSYTAESIAAAPGGKGINVARVLATLGATVRVLGFAGGPTGEAMREGLEAEGLVYSLTRIEENSRTCWAVRDPVRHTSTEVNEAGPTVRPAELDDFLTTYRLLVRGAGLVAICGSLPRGVRPSLYADLIGEAWEHGVPCLLDTGNQEALALGVAAGPLLVKPNAREAALLAGHPVTTLEEADRAARGILDQGALLVALTLGPLGAVLRTPRGGWHATAPGVTPVNTVGSGDAFLAGFINRFVRALPARRPYAPGTPEEEVEEGGFLAAARDPQVLSEALRLAVAAGTANALTPGAGQVRPQDVERLLQGVEISTLET